MKWSNGFRYTFAKIWLVRFPMGKPQFGAECSSNKIGDAGFPAIPKQSWRQRTENKWDLLLLFLFTLLLL